MQLVEIDEASGPSAKLRRVKVDNLVLEPAEEQVAHKPWCQQPMVEDFQAYSTCSTLHMDMAEAGADLE